MNHGLIQLRLTLEPMLSLLQYYTSCQGRVTAILIIINCNDNMLHTLLFNRMLKIEHWPIMTQQVLLGTLSAP